MKIFKLIIDTLMAVLMPMLMAYSLIGENNHEIIGICIFVIFIVHHVLNRKWWTSLFKGKYNAVRVLNTVVNLSLAVFMIMQPVSGVLLSKHILKEVTISGAASTLRTIHMTLSYWGFIILSLHLGLHIRVISAKLKGKMNKAVKITFTVLFLLIAAYGVYAFINRGFADYMFMKVMFAFFDPNESKILFFLDYAAVMVLAANIAYWMQRGLLFAGRRKKKAD